MRPKLDVKHRLEIHSTKTETCWIWNGSKVKRGYGILRFGDRNKMAHRVSYEEYVGLIPDGLCVLHRCDVPSCINPDHLFLGTKSENMIDKVMKDRQAKGEQNGSSKLKNHEVLAIRQEIKLGKTVRGTAAAFNVSMSLVSAISNGKIWKHI